MNWRQTAVLLVLFAAVAIFAWTLRDSEPTQLGPGAPTATPGAMLDIEAAAVSAVRVEGDGSSYELTRDDADDWLVDGRPASDTVNGVVERIADPDILRVLPEDRDPDDYGFASPWLTVTLTVSDTERGYFVGDEVPTSSSDRYLRPLDGGPIRTASAFDIEQLQEWLTTPPDAPTATPEPSATPEEGAEDGADEEGADTDDEEGADGEDEAGGTDGGDPEAEVTEEADGDPSATPEAPGDDATPEATALDEDDGAATATAPTATSTATPEADG